MKKSCWATLIFGSLFWLPNRIYAADLEILLDEVPRDAWLVLAPLTGTGVDFATRLPFRVDPTDPQEIKVSLAAGPVLACTGAPHFSVTCKRLLIEDGATLDPGFAPGRPVRVRVRAEALPVSGARVAVVPEGLESERPLVLPLDLERRAVETDADGLATLPALAPGRYFLEITAPTGRISHGPTFEITPPEPDLDPEIDLGDFDLPIGLELEVEVFDGEGNPLAGAEVRGRQGRTPTELIEFAASTDADGLARLSGLTVDFPLDLTCAAPGFGDLKQSFADLPVVVGCQLFPTAASPPKVAQPPIKPGAQGKTGTLRVALRNANDPCRGCRVVVGADERLTDRKGEAIFKLPPGTYTVARPKQRNLGSISIVEPEAETRTAVVVKNQETVLVFGGTTSRVEVIFRPRPEKTQQLIATSKTRTLRVWGNADGIFELDRKSGEDFDLFLEHFDPATSQTFRVRQGRIEANTRDRITIERPSARVLATIWRRDGRPFQGKIRLTGIENNEIIAVGASRADGSFELAFLPAGVFTLWAGDETVATVSLRAGQVVDLQRLVLREFINRPN